MDCAFARLASRKRGSLLTKSHRCLLGNRKWTKNASFAFAPVQQSALVPWLPPAIPSFDGASPMTGDCLMAARRPMGYTHFPVAEPHASGA